MIQQHTPTKKICLYSFPWGNSQGRTIVNHKICRIVQPGFSFGFGSRSSKSSPCRVPRETRATESRVTLEVFSDKSAESDSSIKLLTHSKEISLSQISVCNAMKILRRLLQGLQSKPINNSLFRRELP